MEFTEFPFSSLHPPDTYCTGQGVLGYATITNSPDSPWLKTRLGPLLTQVHWQRCSATRLVWQPPSGALPIILAERGAVNHLIPLKASTQKWPITFTYISSATVSLTTTPHLNSGTLDEHSHWVSRKKTGGIWWALLLTCSAGIPTR